MDGSVRGAKAESHISEPVQGDTAHPAPGSVRLVGALLEDRHRSGRHTAQLEPANASYIVRFHRKISYQRFVSVPKTAVGQPIHQAVGNGVHIVACTAVIQLRHAGASERAKHRKGRSGRAREESKGRPVPKGNTHAKVIDV